MTASNFRLSTQASNGICADWSRRLQRSRRSAAMDCINQVGAHHRLWWTSANHNLQPATCNLQLSCGKPHLGGVRDYWNSV